MSGSFDLKMWSFGDSMRDFGDMGMLKKGKICCFWRAS